MKKEDVLKVLEETNKVLGNLTDKQIEQYASDAHKQQNKERASKGGNASLGSGNYKHIQSMGGKVIGKQNVESGHLKSICSDGGKAGAKVQMENGLGIHVDAETRREWSRLGGLKSISHLNRERQCPYCEMKTKGAAYNRWHGENCKHKVI